MMELMKRSIRCAIVLPLVLGPLAGATSAQDADAPEDFRPLQLIFHLVQADGFTEQDPEIADVVTELRKLFNFKGYRLLSTSVQNIVLERSYADRLDGSGTQRIVVGDSDVPWELSVDVTSRPSSPAMRVEVSLTSVVDWSIRENARRDPVERYLEASVTVRDGQKVVLGSTRPSAEEPTLILVVTPRSGSEGQGRCGSGP